MSATRREFRPVIHETGGGRFFSDTLRPEFRDQMLPPRREYGCLDASETISAGSHRAYDGGSLASFVFR